MKFIAELCQNHLGKTYNVEKLLEACVKNKADIVKLQYINSKNFGLISGLFLILYATFRFFLEFLREPDLHIGLLFNIITMGQVLSLPLFVFGIFIILINGKNRNS